MFKIILFFTVFFTFNLTIAQIIPVELILSSDALNTYEYEIQPLHISSTANVVISGQFESENSVLIKPNSLFSIKIIPKIAVYSTSNGSIIIDPPVTTLRPKPPGLKDQTGTLTIYPNPVQTDLTFTTVNKLFNSYSIYDKTGLLKMSQTIAPTNTATINVSSFIPDTYILMLNLTNGQQLSIQFIKN